MSTKFAIAATVTAIMTLSGCSSEEGPMRQAHGIVRYNGKPLPGGSIMFIPIGKGLTAASLIEPDGTFTLKTMTKSMIDGATVGDFKVCVMAPVPLERPADYPMFPLRYQNADESGLVETVGDKNEFEIDLKD